MTQPNGCGGAIWRLLAGPLANEFADVFLGRRTRFLLRRAQVEETDHFFPHFQAKPLGHVGRIGQISRTPYATDALGVGRQQDCMGRAAAASNCSDLGS